MQRKVLIIGPSFFGYCRSIADGFESLGWKSCIYQYDEPVHPFNWKNKLLRKLYPQNPRLLRQSRERVNSEAVDAFKRCNPELVFIYNGDALTIETVQYFRSQSCKVAVWLLDGAYKCPESVKLAPVVDAYFCFERDDLTFASLQQASCYFLPQGFDPQIYYPVPGSTKQIDVLFVGTLYGYPDRISLLRALTARLKARYRIAVYGVYKPIYKNPLKWLLREDRSIFKNRNITPQEVNRLYNQTRVCINIHHIQSKDGANPKVFEIPATGTFQIVDENPYVSTLFDGRDVRLFDRNSPNELITAVEQVLTDRLYERPTDELLIRMKQHTFTERIKQALTIIYPSTALNTSSLLSYE